MIIKRRVTRGFVQIANEVVRDRRISLAAHGLLHYLLSLPDDWEINLKQIEKFWGIGRDRRRSLFAELKKSGWAQLERLTSDDDGTFLGQRWIIGDEPGPEITDSEAADDDSEDTDDAAPTMNTTAAPESQGPDALVSASRATPSPTVGLSDGRVARPPENPSLPRRKNSDEEIDSTNTSVVDANSNLVDDNGEPPPTFGSMLKLWPADNIASAYACEKSFAKLSAWQKVQAHRAVSPYLTDCRSKGQPRICDLRTYLDERRFERFVGKGSTGRQLYACKRGTPQAERWREHYRRHQPEKLRMFEYLMSSSGTATTETEWPPPIDPMAKAG